nr:PREDICTED: protein cereblon-like [Bemisia tabaci]
MMDGSEDRVAASAVAMESASSEDYESDAEMPVATTFDRTLSHHHSYLGETEVLRGRTFYEDGVIVSMPLLNFEHIVVPNQIFPLTVFEDYFKDLLLHCIENDHTFGVISGRYNNFTKNSPLMGTTVEIYEYNYGNNSDNFIVKTKGRQRFKLIETVTFSSSFQVAKVEILPEVQLPDFFSEIKSHSLNRYRKSRPQRCKKREAALTPWPNWVYDQYDAKILVTKIKDALYSGHKGLSVSIPDDPSELSFWMAQYLAINDEQKLQILRTNNPIERLRLEYNILLKSRFMCCSTCKNKIGMQSDMFSMSVDGPQGTFCNPNGYVHDVLTFYQVKGLHYGTHPPSLEFSWFPEYAWTVAYCDSCMNHLGWKFTATKDQLVPKTFWGIRRKGLVAQIDCNHEYNEGLLSMLE